jgi:transient receptor potential cation channel subfamily A protein 1
MIIINNIGIGRVRNSFIYISAAIVVFMALVRIGMEIYQLKLRFPRYFLDETNWIEMVLFLSSITFVWVFHNDCLCPLKWQWQVGVVAVFLGWIVLTLFISKFPKIGIYVLMFLNVFRTFLKVLLLSIFLVLAFALTFYLAFTEPEITV